MNSVKSMAILTTVELEYTVMNTGAFGVQRSMKGSTTVKELVVSKVAQVG